MGLKSLLKIHSVVSSNRIKMKESGIKALNMNIKKINGR